MTKISHFGICLNNSREDGRTEFAYFTFGGCIHVSNIDDRLRKQIDIFDPLTEESYEAIKTAVVAHIDARIQDMAKEMKTLVLTALDARIEDE